MGLDRYGNGGLDRVQQSNMLQTISMSIGFELYDASSDLII